MRHVCILGFFCHLSMTFLFELSVKSPLQLKKIFIR